MSETTYEADNMTLYTYIPTYLTYLPSRRTDHPTADGTPDKDSIE